MPKLTLLHDARLDIATGKSRKEVNWKNRQTFWSNLVETLSTTKVTHETHAEYMLMKDDRKAEIKDVGGFVGGYITAGRRKPSHILHRSVMTLDLDHHVPVDLWDTFTLMFGNAAVIHSTHKHTPSTPRYRLIIPLDRIVQAEEYMAVSRKIAGQIGINHFDDTTFQVERLMYWPSTPKDIAYEFNYQDGPFVSVDDTLAMYTDWTDSSEWPISDRVDKVMLRNMIKAGDPLEKHGIVGVFCRTFTVAEAIETFLPDIYEACDVEDRYTYLHGSTAAGLITYEDKWAYSHHGTDPTGGKLCNAFDLVRIHKFGLKDEDIKADTPINKTASYLAMQEFAAKDRRVKLQLGAEKTANFFTEFEDDFIEGDILEFPTEPSPIIRGFHGGDPGKDGDRRVTSLEPKKIKPDSNEWLADLDADKKGNWLSTIGNIHRVLNNDPGLKGRIAYNDFEKREVALRDLPWRKVNDASMNLTDKDDAALRWYLEKPYGMTGLQKVQDGLDITLMDMKFHPVRDYLKAQMWDGENRIDTLFIDYLGAEDNIYTRAVTRKWLIAAVARILVPGIKFDTAIVLVGDQGIGKSTILKMLGQRWFSDSFNSIKGNAAFEALQGCWIMELAELAALSNAEVDAIKHFISKPEDRYRVAYGRRTDYFPRQCVFIGTTNNRDFLRDASGNRRWWPVETGVQEPLFNVFSELTPDIVGQLWAEALEAFERKEALYLPHDIEIIAKEVQASHMKVDDRRNMIVKYLEMLLPANWGEMDVYQRRQYIKNGPDEDMPDQGTVIRRKVTAADIWCEVIEGLPKDMTTHNTKFIHDIMRQLPDWKMTKGLKMRTEAYGIQRGYSKIKSRL